MRGKLSRTILTLALLICLVAAPVSWAQSPVTSTQGLFSWWNDFWKSWNPWLGEDIEAEIDDESLKPFGPSPKPEPNGEPNSMPNGDDGDTGAGLDPQGTP